MHQLVRNYFYRYFLFVSPRKDFLRNQLHEHAVNAVNFKELQVLNYLWKKTQTLGIYASQNSHAYS